MTHYAAWPIVVVLTLALPASSSPSLDQQAPPARASSIEDLAEALVKSSPVERDALIARESALITVDLVVRLNEIGEHAYDGRQYDKAGDAFRAAETIAVSLHDAVGLARALVNAGRVAMAGADLTHARDYLQRGIDALRSIHDNPQLARAMTILGVVHWRLGDFDDAQENFERALGLQTELRNDAGRGSNLHNLGLINYERGRITDAIAFYRQALAVRVAMHDKVGIGSTSNNLGTVYRDLGDYVQAFEYYRKSLALKEELRDDSDIAYTLNNIGILYKEQGNFRQALDTYSKALAKFEATNNRDGIARVMVNTGIAYQGLGEHDRALSQFQRALEIKEALNQKQGIAIVLCNIGQVYYSRKAYAEAADYYRRCLPLFDAIGDQRGVAETYVNLSELHERQGRHEEALQMANRAIALADQIGRDEIVWQARSVAATLHRAMNQPDKARAELEAAIALIESLRSRVAGGGEAQQTYFESKLAPYHALVDLLVDQHKPAEALIAAERARARVLLDVIQSGRVNVTTAMTAAEKEQEQRLTNRLVELNAERFRARTRAARAEAQVNSIESRLDQTRLELEAFHTTLYTAHPELRLRRAETPAMSIDDARDLLPDTKTVLMEFVVAEELTTLFVVRRPRAGEPDGDGESTVRLAAYRLSIPQKTLADRIERFRGMLSGVDNRYVRDARDLYDLLLAPAAAELRGASRLVIVPDGPLWELPFQVLRTPQSDDLIDRHAIMFAPSLSVLRESRRRRLQRESSAGARPLTALAIGNPTLGGEAVARVEALMDERLEPLPEAERQVRALQPLYGTERSRIYVGDSAREEDFKAAAASFRVLHIATHGILNDRSPMYSHLVFAQHSGARDDGLLEARELMQMDITADVAVMSACETARGRVSRGEGMMGLTWAMFVAGVPTTVVSQWKVRSDSTADLMIEFHRHLKAQLARPAGQRDVAGALRAAALKVKRDPRYRHPFHWAPFVLVGDGY
jgi:CHAT domain-containing protein/Tfp pilus assembly protein PilF